MVSQINKQTKNLFLTIIFLSFFFISVLLLIPGTNYIELFPFYTFTILLSLYFLSITSVIVELIFMFMIFLVLMIRNKESIKYLFLEWIFVLISMAIMIFVINKRQKEINKRRIFCESIEEKYNNLSYKLKNNKNFLQGFEHKIAHYKILNDIIFSLNATLDLTTIIDFVMKKLQKIFGEHKYIIRLLEDDKMVVKKSYNYEKTQDYKITEAKDLDKWLIETRLPLLVEDMKKEVRFQNGDIRSFMAVPILKREKIIGIIKVEDTQNANIFSQSDLRLLIIISNLFSIIIQNAYFYLQIQKLAITDGLTQTYVHTYFHERLEADLERIKNNKLNLSLLLIDIDHFKQCNDKYGHLAGDIILERISRILKESIRTIDMLSRYGGEEFAIYLLETNKQGALTMAERLREKIEKSYFNIDAKEIKVTISIGVSGYPIDAQTKNELIEKADIALYEAKQQGRNKVIEFENIKKWNV